MPYGWIFSMGTGKYVVDSSAFGKKCTKIPGSLTLPGIFSCTPGTSRTCDLQIRSLTLYPTELRALISLIILPQQGRIVKRKCGKIGCRKISATFSAHLGDFLKKCRLPSSQTGKKLLQ